MANSNGSEGVVAEVHVKVDPTMQIGQGNIKPNVRELPRKYKTNSVFQ